ncbi:MAG TPA: ethanolamine ammonia-lyase reactivating factor EutA [Candidatus Acidoferrales bacterium]|nr:ethanolamine ammonia-lyase reactivating factor EutA [Candidatus Acidoferrales bacterium]
MRLRTVGIDIGTTTSHLIFSELTLERQGIRLSSAYTVVERKVVSRSEVRLTPYASPKRIDTDALAAYVDTAYAAAGWTRDMIDTGAVIATGEAARKENAANIVALFSGQGGRFVCATAGHHLEALLAAHGSGPVPQSRTAGLVLNIDIGGGTTKFAICRGGHVTETAAIDLGARRIRWADPAARPDQGRLERTASLIVDEIMRIADGVPLREPSLWLTEPLRERGPFKTLVISGGVGEYVNRNETREFGDLGKLIGAAIAKRLAGRQVVRAVESIRATCIGASQYTIQVSGDTLFLTRPEMLPLRDLAAIAIHPDSADAAAIARAVRSGIERLDRDDGKFAIAVRWDHGPAYSALTELCHGIHEGVRETLHDGRPLVVVIDADVAGIVGQALQDEMGIRSPLVCVDQIQLSDLDFIDIGQVVPDKGVVPVVVKSLVFSER